MPSECRTTLVSVPGPQVVDPVQPDEPGEWILVNGQLIPLAYQEQVWVFFWQKAWDAE